MSTAQYYTFPQKAFAFFALITKVIQHDWSVSAAHPDQIKKRSFMIKWAPLT